MDEKGCFHPIISMNQMMRLARLLASFLVNFGCDFVFGEGSLLQHFFLFIFSFRILSTFFYFQRVLVLLKCWSHHLTQKPIFFIVSLFFNFWILMNFVCENEIQNQSSFFFFMFYHCRYLMMRMTMIKHILLCFLQTFMPLKYIIYRII